MTDRILDRLYLRLGPRLLWLIVGWGVFSGAAILSFIGVLGLEYFEVEARTMFIGCAGWFAIMALIAAFVCLRVLEELLPVLRWDPARPEPSRAVAACHALVAEGRVARRVVAVLFVLTPVHAISFTVLLGQPWWFAFPAVVAALTAAGGFGTALTAVIDLLQHPVRADVFAHLPPDFELHEQRTPLAMQPVTLTPIPMLVAAFLVGAIGDNAQDGAARFALATGAGLVLVLGVSMVVMVRAQAWVAPIKDLIAAARRIEHGDLSVSIPVVASDETGTLASHFNAMLVDLREREMLRTDLAAREEELLASRARVITAADAERRRVERNLHDGAQQRLVALQLDLRLLEDAAVDARQPALSELAADARRDLDDALSELRELARGLHPAVLDSDGLAPAMRELSDRAKVAVETSVDVDRLPPAVESTLYFVASEALTNVAKHAKATMARVRVTERDGAVTLEVTDDGVGGARTRSGSGINGLKDRVDAAGGTLQIVSIAGAGTRVTATIPTEWVAG